MDQEILDRCQQLVGYQFADRDLLILALTHASVASTRARSNERLEFLGDAVLALAVCHHLYRTQEDLMEGDMTKIKSAVVSRHTCAEVAEEIGLGELLRTGKGMADASGLPMSVSAAVFEAIIGAIYLDGGLEPAVGFILTHMEPHIEIALVDEHQRNYKSLLQQYAQRISGSMPTYRLLDEKGPDHSRCFEVAAAIDGREFPSAWGRSKKEAEQKAARRALRTLAVLPE